MSKIWCAAFCAMTFAFGLSIMANAPCDCTKSNIIAFDAGYLSATAEYNVRLKEAQR